MQLELFEKIEADSPDAEALLIAKLDEAKKVLFDKEIVKLSENMLMSEEEPDGEYDDDFDVELTPEEESDYIEDEPNMDVDLTPEEEAHAHEDIEDLDDDFWNEFDLEEDA